MRKLFNLVCTKCFLVCLGTPLKVYFEHQGLVCSNICLGAATEFVCGSDGITHTNPCTLHGYNCSGYDTESASLLVYRILYKLFIGDLWHRPMAFLLIHIE